jgi:membrane protease YdiL (CAAX protease family)
MFYRFIKFFLFFNPLLFLILFSLRFFKYNKAPILDIKTINFIVIIGKIIFPIIIFKIFIDNLFVIFFKNTNLFNNQISCLKLLVLHIMILFVLFKIKFSNLKKFKYKKKTIFFSYRYLIAFTIFYFNFLILIFIINILWKNFLLRYFKIAKINQLQNITNIIFDINNQKNFTKYYFISTLIVTIIIASISEELLFRNIIYCFFKKNFSIFTSTLISSLIFSLSHNHFYSFFQLFILSIFISQSYEKLGIIFFPIIFHVIFNIFNLLIFLCSNFLIKY